MQIHSSQVQFKQCQADCLVVGVTKSTKLSSSLKEIDVLCDKTISKLIKSKDIKTGCGSTRVLFLPKLSFKRLVIVGLDESKSLTPHLLHKAIDGALSALRTLPVTKIAVALDTFHGAKLKWEQLPMLFVQPLSRFDYSMTTYKQEKTKATNKQVTFVSHELDLSDLKRQSDCCGAVLKGMALTKTLGDMPANDCTPTKLASTARSLGTQNPKIKVKVLKKAELEKLKMGSLLSVAAASDYPPYLIEMQYKNAGSSPPIVLVGKGITFDTGGNSMKPPGGMMGMKYDMCGAATVLGVMETLAKLKPKINVIGLIPTCENMVDSRATRPGDIVKSMSGQTIEVLNTDAEGRLILADALTYAERYKPKYVLTMATLTGACVAAFGNVTTALLTNHQPLVNQLLKSGDAQQDRAWQLPLWDEYQGLIDSKLADMANIGGPYAGTITSACFLSRFTKKYHWAHMDIAGTAATSMGQRKDQATGRPVPLLIDFLLNEQ